MVKEREYDVVVFGATGVTGSQVAKYLKDVAEKENLVWAVAGRRPAELKKLFPNVPALYANCDEPSSIVQMCSQTHAVLNLVGPFRYYGRVVVESCIKAKTNYFDVCGEPEFMEKVAYEFGEQAKKNGIVIVSACGFDSVPADIGVLTTQAAFSKAGGVCNSVEAYIKVQSTKNRPMRGNYATWWSLIESVASASDFRKWRKTTGCNEKHVKVIGPKLEKQQGFRWKERFSAWVTPFMGADASVMKRTQLFLQDNPSYDKSLSAIQTAAYFQVETRKNVFLFSLFGAIFFILMKFAFGRKLLLDFPQFFTYGAFQKTPPKEEDLEHVVFQSTFIGKGYSDKSKVGGPENLEVLTLFSGPEPGYLATSRILIHSYRAVTTFNEAQQEEKDKKTGVLTPGIAVWGTDLLTRLRSSGFVIHVKKYTQI